MWRKRGSPARGFKQPAPYDPITGKFAPIGLPCLPDRVLGILDGPLSQGTSAKVHVYTGTPGSEKDSGQIIVAWDWLMKLGTTAIAAGKKVMCVKVNSNWYLEDWECP